MLSTCPVRSGNGSRYTRMEGENEGDAEGFAQGTCVHVGVSFQEAAAAEGASFTSQTRCWGFRGGLGLVKSGWGTGMGPLPTGLASHEWWPRKGTMARKGHRVGGWTLRRALHLLLTHSGDLGSHCWREDGCRLEAASSPKGLGCLRYVQEAGMVVVGVA